MLRCPGVAPREAPCRATAPLHRRTRLSSGSHCRDHRDADDREDEHAGAVPCRLAARSAVSRARHRALVRFFVVLATAKPMEAVVLQSVPDADSALVAFNQEWERLLQNRVEGELMVVRHNDATRILLRQPLG